MAQELGIKRCWYHPGPKAHYDIPKRRIQEIQEDTTFTRGSSREILRLIKG